MKYIFLLKILNISFHILIKQSFQEMFDIKPKTRLMFWLNIILPNFVDLDDFFSNLPPSVSENSTTASASNINAS